MKNTTRIQLGLMMFLEFFIWGAWFVTMGTYLMKNMSATGVEVGTAYLSQALGAVIAPFIIGLIADRYFAAQKILGVLHLLGGALLWYSSTINDLGAFIPLIIAYMVIYMPTIALANSVAFKQMTNIEKQFPLIRSLGTIGWIIAGLVIGWLAWEAKDTLDMTFKLAAGASFVLGVFSFFLPNTPPPKAGATGISMGDILGLDALGLLKDRNYLIFFVASVLICIPLAFYYSSANPFLNELNIEAAAAKMSLGQMAEVVFMLLMPLAFARLGVRKMLLIGMAAWVLRYLLFANGNAEGGMWMLYLGILLHGICYDFFFVTGQIYTENKAGERFKSAAQGLITLGTYGVGMLIGFLFAGMVIDKYLVSEGAHNWENIWLVPAAIAGVVLLLFGLTFRERKAA